MTTIATDGKSMAADGQVQDHTDTILAGDHRKVFKLNDGRIVGGAGNSFDVGSWIEWLEKGKEGPCPVQSNQFSAMILNTDGSLLWVDHKGREAPTPVPCAIGSGSQFALGAMDAGASPTKAVAIARNRDLWTGGDIVSESLS